MGHTEIGSACPSLTPRESDPWSERCGSGLGHRQVLLAGTSAHTASTDDTVMNERNFRRRR
jgi:hypothetical protein